MPRVECTMTTVGDAEQPDGKVGEGACAECRRCGHKAVASRVTTNIRGTGYITLGRAAVR